MSLFRALEESAFSAIISSLNNLFNQTSSFKDDAETAASSASTSATNASNSATSASTSASTASTAATTATNASTAAINAKDDAETARDDAETAAGAALVSEQNASTSATNAATSATQASTSADNASTSATNASTSATNALNSEQKAEKWAEEDEDIPVETDPNQFSAKHHAIKAEGFKDSAETSAQNASTSETNASNSASSASTSASSASTSATNASNSASAALTSEQNAATSETNAETSATNAANSATEAEGFKNAAEDAAGLSIQGIKVISRLNEVGDLPNDPLAGDAYVIEVSGNDRIYVYDGNDWTWFSVGSGTAWGEISGTLSDQSDLNTALGNKEDAFSKNTAFNKNYGTTADTVTEGNDSRLSDARTPISHAFAGTEHSPSTIADVNSKISDATLIDTTDSRLSDSREWTADTISQEEAETGTATTRRAFTSQRVRQSISAWWNATSIAISKVTGLQTALDSKLESSDISDFETTTQLNSRDTANRDRTNHTGNQAISTVSGLQTALDGKEPSFNKNTGFNRDFGSSANTVTEGNDSRLSNSREWTASTVGQSEAEAGTVTTRRAWTAQRVRQAIVAWWATITLTKADVGLSNVDNTSDATVITEARKVSITTKTAAWTFSLAEGDYYRSTGASDVNATVPPNASVAYPVGTVITIRQAGNGVVTLVAGSGVTLNGDLKTAGQNKNISAVKLDANLWDIVGGVA